MKASATKFLSLGVQNCAARSNTKLQQGVDTQHRTLYGARLPWNDDFGMFSVCTVDILRSSRSARSLYWLFDVQAERQTLWYHHFWLLGERFFPDGEISLFERHIETQTAHWCVRTRRRCVDKCGLQREWETSDGADACPVWRSRGKRAWGWGGDSCKVSQDCDLCGIHHPLLDHNCKVPLSIRAINVEEKEHLKSSIHKNKQDYIHRSVVVLLMASVSNNGGNEDMT